MASLGETIQLITGIGALIVGIAYVVGGLIVNVHLSRYGITEYQILRVKYLVVGLVYIVSWALIFLLSLIIMSLGGLIFYLPVGLIFLIWFFSLNAVYYLLMLGTDRDNVPTNRADRILFIVLSSISLSGPIAIFYRNLVINDATSPILNGFAIFNLIVGILGQVYFYARYIYGNETSTDVIGMGIPVTIQIALDKDSIDILQQMGIAMVSANMTGNLSLMDETDEHYLIKIDADKNTKVVKIDKKMVKGIVYLGVHKEPSWLARFFRRFASHSKPTNT